MIYLLEIILLFVIIIIAIFIAYGYYSPEIKGAIGESRVSRKLENLNNEEYKVLNNILLSTSNGLSQIDQIVISIYGIFVIETKNYSGWIHGNENSEYWTQTIYKKKTKFRNPIKQNWAHIYALKEILSDYKQVIYHPIVVFTGGAELKNISSNLPVIYDFQLLQVVTNTRTTRNLSIEHVINIVDILNKVCIKDKQIKKKHIDQIRNHAYKRKNNEKSLVCPKCGGELVVRDGPYGNFYGCTNYPNCRYTLSNRA